MEKTKLENMKSVFEDITNDFHNTTKLKLKNDITEFEFEVMKTVPMSDVDAMAKLIAVAAFVDGDYNPLTHKLYLSKYAIEYLTNIPIPMLETEDEKEPVVDLNLCYELYRMIYDEYAYGVDGILDESFVRLEKYVNEYIDEIKKRKPSPIDEFITELTDSVLESVMEAKALFKDYATNPASTLKLLERIKDITSELEK